MLVLEQLVSRTLPGRIRGFELHDVRTGTLDTRLTGRAQSARCVFCKKTVATWKARPSPKRNPKGMVTPLSLVAAVRDHLPGCAEGWMWSVLARWAIGHATDAERAAVATWRERDCAGDPRRGDAAAMPRVFDRLPHPPGSEVAQELEVALISISRLWDP
ncbi:MAG: hypothetical protein ABI678_13455 [Kofleriaceae bacterium]